MTKYIVLAHGVLGFSSVDFGGIDLGILKVGKFNLLNYFNGVKSSLENGSSYKVVAPPVAPVGSIDTRALSFYEKLHAFIIENNVPEKSIAIFAHSMGGLDARQALLLQNKSLVKYVKCLVTIGTPHLGSPIAKLLNDENFITSSLYKKASNVFGDSIGALKDLTPEFCEDFDKKTENAGDVEYYSIAGVIDKTKDRSNYSLFFKELGEKINELNDGVVAVSSATKNKDDGWNHLGNWDVDHAGLVGWFGVESILNFRTLKKAHIKRYNDLAKMVLPLD